MLNFNLDDVKALEKSVLQEVDRIYTPKCYYFKEHVARHLHAAWVANPDDSRLIEYCLPLIHSLMVKHVGLLESSRLDEAEAFQVLVLGMMKAMPNYSPDKGKLYSYVCKTIYWRIVDVFEHKTRELPLADWDALIDDKAAHDLDDFLQFVRYLQGEEGPSGGRMLDALLSVLTEDAAKASVSRDAIIRLVSAKSGFPPEIVAPYYARVVDSYVHGYAVA